MKINSILPAAILAAILGLSAGQASAQSNVYSLNVVGYYNVPLVPGWNLVANHFITTNYTANYLLGDGPADGSLLYRFDPVAQAYAEAGTYFAGFGWYPLSGDTNDPALSFPPGESVFIWTTTNWVATFVGGVAQGYLVNPLPAGFSLKASLVPQAGLLQTDLVFPPYPGDVVWQGAGPPFSAHAYADANTGWTPSEPSVDVGRGFFLYRDAAQATSDHWWLRNFTVQFAPSPPGGAHISSLTVRRGKAVLGIKNTTGAAYNVQFSTDRVSWMTVASKQTASVWQEPARGGGQGYYQLVNP